MAAVRATGRGALMLGVAVLAIASFPVFAIVDTFAYVTRGA